MNWCWNISYNLTRKLQSSNNIQHFKEPFYVQKQYYFYCLGLLNSLQCAGYVKKIFQWSSIEFTYINPHPLEPWVVKVQSGIRSSDENKIESLGSLDAQPHHPPAMIVLRTQD